MWEILILTRSAIENSNKFQKTRFWKDKSIENVVTLEGLPFNSSMISFHFWMFKKLIHTLQNNVHMLSFLFCNGFTLGPTTHATLVTIKIIKVALHLVYFEKQILGRVIFLKHSKYISFFY